MHGRSNVQIGLILLKVDEELTRVESYAWNKFEKRREILEKQQNDVVATLTHYQEQQLSVEEWTVRLEQEAAWMIRKLDDIADIHRLSISHYDYRFGALEHHIQTFQHLVLTLSK